MLLLSSSPLLSWFLHPLGTPSLNILPGKARPRRTLSLVTRQLSRTPPAGGILSSMSVSVSFPNLHLELFRAGPTCHLGPMFCLLTPDFSVWADPETLRGQDWPCGGWMCGHLPELPL